MREMPLGERNGDKSESRYCGVEMELHDDMPQLLAYNISSGGLHFVVAHLMDPSYRPSLMGKDSGGSGVLPFAGSDLVLSRSQWSSHVVGFAGYFDATFYQDVHLGIEPLTATPNMFSWFGMNGVTSPCPLPVHNSNGRSFWVFL